MLQVTTSQKNFALILANIAEKFSNAAVFVQRAQNGEAAIGLSTVGLRLSKVSGRLAGRRDGQDRGRTMRRRSAKMRPSATIIAAGMSPTLP